MRNPKYSSIDPNTGDVIFNGPLSIEKGDHHGMPSRTKAYRPGYQRGHVNASSLGGVNSQENIVPQHADLNHGAYYSVEKGERISLKNSAGIESEKMAIVNGHPGECPVVFMVNDSVTYPDGHTEVIHHSFTNESYADQSMWNDTAASLPGTFDGDNPGDGLRYSMDTESYASLMEAIDAEMPGLDAEYAPADFSGVPDFAEVSTVSADIGTDVENSSADCNADLGGDDSSISADAE